MATAPTQPQPAEGERDDETPGSGAQAPTQPQPAEGADDEPAGTAGSPA